MKLYRFYWTDGISQKEQQWKCAAANAEDACRGFCIQGYDVDDFKVSCDGDVAIVEVYSDGSGVKAE